MSTNDEPLVGSARTATDRLDASIPESAEPNAAEKAAAPAGAAAGALAGGTAGTLVAGPVGTVIGAIAGAIGGWWAGVGVEKHAELPTTDETYYRHHYEASAPAGGTWERARPVYQLGHAAAANPAYRSRSFSDIEPDLQNGWTPDAASPGDDWHSVRDLARAAYEHRSDAIRAEMELANPGTTDDRSSHAGSRVDFGPHTPAAARRELRSNP
jgi:hypothetical protein